MIIKRCLLLPLFVYAAIGSVLPAYAGKKPADDPPLILKVEETDQDGGRHVLDNRSVVADISSTIHISIDRAKLQNAATPTGNFGIQKLLTEAQVLAEAAKTGTGALPALRTALSTWVKSDKKETATDALTSALTPVRAAITKIISQSNGSPAFQLQLVDAIKSQTHKSTVERAAAIFQVAAAEAERIQKEVDTTVKQEGVSIQMGAWLVTNGTPHPIHLPGFDTYPVGDTFIVDRWNISLTTDQQTQLQDLKAKAGDVDLKKILADNVDQTLSDIKRDILNVVQQACIDDISTEFTHFDNTVGAADKAKVVTIINDTKAAIKTYTDFINGLKAKYESGGLTIGATGTNLLLSINIDLTAFQAETSTFVAAIKTQVNALKALDGIANDVKAGIAMLATNVEGCVSKLGNADVWFSGQLGSLRLLIAGQQIDTSLLEFGDKVTRFDIANLPTDVSFPLNQTGSRAPGDMLVIKLASARRVSDQSDKAQAKELEARQYVLFRVLPHIDTTVSLILARNGDKFQAAPSFSVLYKPGSRNALYNRILDVGVGVNVSTLNFSHNDNPEIGVGLTLSAFRDYLQVGYGYNVTVNKGFFFFGLRLLKF